MKLLNYIIWDVSPFLIDATYLKIKWYGVFMALAISSTYWVLQKVAVSENRAPSPLVDLFIYVFVFGMLGARIVHVIFYDWAYFSQNPLDILMIWKGGLASHGGVLGIAFAIWFFTRNQADYSFNWVLNAAGFLIPLGSFWVRLGNLFNSELYGKVTDVPWAFVFVNQSPLPRHPSPLYEAIWGLIVFALLLFAYQKKCFDKGLQLFGLCVILGLGARFFFEFFKEDAFTSQMLNIPLIIVGLILFLYPKIKNIASNTK